MQEALILTTRRDDSPLLKVHLQNEQIHRRVLQAISELEHVTFTIENSDAGLDYELSIGDVPLTSVKRFGPFLIWEQDPYFESTRGLVSVHLRSRRRDGVSRWTARARIDVNVIPTKLGELRYESMESDLRRFAAALLFDLVSKTLRGLRYTDRLEPASYRQSNLFQLTALEELWQQLAPSLSQISREPEPEIRRRTEIRRFSGVETPDSRSIGRLASVGFDLAHPEAWAQRIPIARKRLSNDTVEHRAILGFLFFVSSQAKRCAEAATKQVDVLEQDREFRDISLKPGLPTLFEDLDRPRIQKLTGASERSQQLADRFRAAGRLPLFRNVIPQLSLPDTPIFRHVPSYRNFANSMMRYVSSSPVIVENGDNVRMKETSRLYEHWVFLQIASAFQEAGLVCEDLSDVVKRVSRNRFTVDLDDEMTVELRLDKKKLVRLRYEPWIMPVVTAKDRGDVLCHGGSSQLGWRPDITIEFLDEEALDPYVVIIDAKYTSRIVDRHWDRTARYLEIRSTQTLAQVARQLWLAVPDTNVGISCKDPAVRWTTSGPSRPRRENVVGRLGLVPTIDDLDDEASSLGQQSVAGEFTRGLLSYVGFSPPSRP